MKNNKESTAMGYRNMRAVPLVVGTENIRGRKESSGINCVITKAGNPCDRQ